MVCMISLEKCKEILEKSGEHYTDEEVSKIRNGLYEFAMIDLELFNQLNSSNGPKLEQ